MSNIERSSAPGIGVVGEIHFSNYGTRAVKIFPGIITPHLLKREVDNLISEISQANEVSRVIFKGISRDPFPMGMRIEDGVAHESPFTVEACIPFCDRDNQPLYWNVIGRNSPKRMPPQEVIRDQQQMIQEILNNPQYAPQSVDALRLYIQQQNPELDYKIVQVTPDNFASLKKNLEVLYNEAFTKYPYNVVSVIGESCGNNLFVAAVGAGGQIYSITGAEYLSLGNVTIAEIGDTASLPGLSGFGPIMKRALFQIMTERGDVPHLAFTDSRLDEGGAVLKANRRAGLQLNPEIILPCHTVIASPRARGIEFILNGPDGQGFPVENMTMTYLRGWEINQIVQKYGKVT